MIGVYLIAADDPVHLIELEVDADDFDFGQVTQKIAGQSRGNWQVSYAEREIGANRYAFFFHFLDTTKPLLGPTGPLTLPPVTPVPDHLKGIEYEQP